LVNETGHTAASMDARELPLAEGNVDPAEMWRKAVAAKWYALGDVPVEFVTRDLCECALAGSPLALAHMPHNLKTPGLCARAIKRGAALRDVPMEFRTRELCQRAIEVNGVHEMAEMPDEFKTAELCAAAVRRHWGYAKYVPQRIMAAEAYLADEQLAAEAQLADEQLAAEAPQGILADAVRQGGAVALFEIPEQFRYVDLCRLAVELNSRSWAYVPDANVDAVRALVDARAADAAADAFVAAFGRMSLADA
jgi:hypothetical protein